MKKNLHMDHQISLSYQKKKKWFVRKPKARKLHICLK